MSATRVDNYYYFPTIETPTKKGGVSKCTYYCGLVPSSTASDVFKKMVDPKEMSVVVSRIKEGYFDNSIITDDVKGFIVARNDRGGKVGPKFEVATFVLTGVNLGSENQTNTWTQTLAKAQSKYNKKAKVNELSELFRPMLANGDAVSPDIVNKTLFDLHNKYRDNYYIQYKYDGHRMICRLHDLLCYSRTAETTHISYELKDELAIVRERIKVIFPQYIDYNINLDGEYYLHGQSLQQISSAIRREQQSESKTSLVFYVFDIPVSTTEGRVIDLTCEQRIKLLTHMRDYFKEVGIVFAKIVFVPTWKPKSYGVTKKLFDMAIQEGYEGLMFKIADKTYEPGYNNFHSRNMIKIKELFREEFLVVGHKLGKGKDEHKLTLICELTENTVTKALNYLNEKGKLMSIDAVAAIGNRFSVRPKLDDATAKQFCEDVLTKKIDIIGKLYTVEFRDWSDKFMPQQPVGIELI